MANISDETITRKIYLIRDKKVMLDRDLADLYGVENKRLGEQVKRNVSKFPGDFMFQLSKEETEDLRSQFATANLSAKSRVLPTVFTRCINARQCIEQWKGQSSKHSDNQDIYKDEREMIVTQKDLLLKIEQLERKDLSHDQNIIQIFKVLKQLIGRLQNWGMLLASGQKSQIEALDVNIF